MKTEDIIEAETMRLKTRYDEVERGRAFLMMRRLDTLLSSDIMIGKNLVKRKKRRK